MTDGCVYLTAGCGRAETEEKRSRFIASVSHTENESAAQKFISDIKSEFKDASHNATCYHIREGNIIRFSDDGEPSGTAGKPALNVFLQENISDFTCVVTRYFGGILLGAGGLVRAYAACAKAGLDSAGRVQMKRFSLFDADISYQAWSRVEQTLRAAAALDNIEYGEVVKVGGSIKTESFLPLCETVKDITAGAVKIKLNKEVILPDK